MKKPLSVVLWIAVAALGAFAYVTLAVRRGEPVNSAYLLIAALCSYAIGFRFYSKWIAAKVLALNDRRATPCEVHDDGKDFCKTNKWIVFGHHFAAISGPGPLVGPVLAAQFGYLPSALWILIGVVLGGAVQDFVILFSSMRRDGKSLAQMVREELNTTAGMIGVAAILAIMIILLAVLGLVVVQALADSPWGVFTVGATIPIAMLMGGYLRWWRVGKVMEASAFGVVLLLLAVWGGQYVYADKDGWALTLKLKQEPLAWMIIAYGFAASVLPVWLLLAPRDYLSTFMKLGTIAALVFGVFIVLPDLKFPAISRFVDGSGPVVPGKLFPFCFITIACGAISGFHTLISSGTTPKMISRENYARPIGYGAMCLESLVAIMALIAACTLDPGVYLSMNIKGEAAATVTRVTGLGYAVSAEQMQGLAKEMGEETLFGRAGGAATLAAGMAQIFSQVTKGKWLDLWYHFAIMFEALFILTTLDAGTRVGRYLIQDVLGSFWKPLGDVKKIGPNVLASGLVVAGWGYFLIQGVRDELGGINSLWPLFGIANQLLASVALCLATTIILKMHLGRDAGDKSAEHSQGREQLRPKRLNPAFALVTLVPLVWLLTVTLTAGWQKILHEETRPGYPRVGFLQMARELNEKVPALEKSLQTARATGNADAVKAAEKSLRENRGRHFNNILDAVVAAIFLGLVITIVLLSVWEWILLLARRRLAVLRETPPVWLSQYAVAESQPMKAVTLLALGFALLKELSGEAQLERARQAQCLATAAPDAESQASAVLQAQHENAQPQPQLTEAQLYLDVTEKRFTGVRRCC